MSSLFIVLLTGHIILGIVGLIANYTTLLVLLKRSASRALLVGSAFTAAIAYILSWIAGGYYYVFYYGGNVKPVIKAGDYAWAHLVVMEWKEHVFLMLPIISLVLALVLWLVKMDENDTKLKHSLILMAATITVLATLITLSGIIISGGAK